jgi:NAD-dependent dihydropyrimidine dehydrogenase PreA subunit
MAKRAIIKINQDKCNGCGGCIPNCPEGAIQVIDGKARLISELFCDGLGACLGHCPQGAISIEEREAQEYNERMVMENIAKQGQNVIKAHLEHLVGHGQSQYLKEAIDFLQEKGIEVPLSAGNHANNAGHSCPGAKVMDFRKENSQAPAVANITQINSQLRQWPVQLNLVPSFAPFLDNADLLIAADCVPFAFANFHQGLLNGKALLVGCPKFDDLKLYSEKITQILKSNQIKSITYAHMEVPCCSALLEIIKSAIASSGKKVPFKEAVISIKGEMLNEF